MTGKSSGRGSRGSRPARPSSSSSPRPPKAGGDVPKAAPSSGFRPKTGTGLSNASSLSYDPPPVQQPSQQPAQPPRNKQPNVPPPAPGPNQGVSSTVPSNVGGPTLAPNPFSDGSLLSNTGLFNNTGVRPSQMEQLLENEGPEMPETPSKANSQEFAELQKLVSTAADDQELLDKFKSRVNEAGGTRTPEQRKDELRRSVAPWINIGAMYDGPKRAPLYLEDGTRNPERPARGAGGPPPPPPPSTAPASSGATAAGTGTAPTDTEKDRPRAAKASKSTKAPQPSSTGNKSLAGTGTKASTGTGNKSSAGTGTSSSTGVSNPPRPSKAPNPVTGKGLLSGTRNSSSGIRKNQPSKKGTSPLSKAPMTAEDVEATVKTSTATTTGTDRSGWESQDNLFEVRVMDNAGITWFTGGDAVPALPTLPSSIDYNTENW